MKPKSTQSFKNPSKIFKNWTLGGSWGILWSSWRHLQRILAPKINKSPKNSLIGPPGTSQEAPKIHQKSIKIRSGGLPESNCFFDRFWDHVLVPFGPNSSNLVAKSLPKSTHASKIYKRRDEDANQFFLELSSFYRFLNRSWIDFSWFFNPSKPSF